MPQFVSLLGLIVFISLAWALSSNRQRFPIHTVFAGLLIQFVLAFLILRTEAGAWLFSSANDAVTKLLAYAGEGTQFVFGVLAKEDTLRTKLGPENGFIFVVTVTGTIIFVSALSSLLYHYGVLQRVVRGLAWVMQRTMRTSGSESLAAAANIFMGQTEAPLVVKPYLPGLTRSELFALMVPGMASIAGGVLAAYVAFGVSAGHLITASFLSAPAALLMAKIMIPETQTSETAAGACAEPERPAQNGIDALCMGAGDGMKLSINVMAMLIAFVAVVALANGMLTGAQSLCGVANPVKLETVFGWVNAPFAWLMGVPSQDCTKVGEVLGTRIVLNEFLGYLSLADMKTAGMLTDRSSMLATYALCGFANFSSIAIQIGGIGALVPERRAELAKLGLRAMVGGLLACYLTASIVGILRLS